MAVDEVDSEDDPESDSELNAARMSADEPITVERFLDLRWELPYTGQWSELVAGVVVDREPPDETHGGAVLALSKALGEFFRNESATGYACFELGLITGRNPDTVRFPAVSCYLRGPLFAESDKAATDVRPQLAVVVATSTGPQAALAQELREWGVDSVWSIDAARHTVEIAASDDVARFAETDTVCDRLLPGFEFAAADLFRPPDWW